MKTLILCNALGFFVIAVFAASMAKPTAAVFSAVVASVWFLMYKKLP